MKKLNAHQMDDLRQTLEHRRAKLLEAAHAELAYGESAPYAAILDEVSDEADRATAATTADLDNEIARRHGAALREVDAALARIGSGSYGRCGDCAADIGYARLAAFPTATRCVDCQRLRERSHAHEATPSL
jgi:RNA polymerase-binding protein DksA